MNLARIRKTVRRALLRLMGSVGAVLALSVPAAPALFSGSYTQNFDGLGISGTILPSGFASLAIPGSTGTYTAANPVNAAGIAAATNNSQTMGVWSAGSAVVSSGAHLYNVGCWDGRSDRALGSDAASTAAQLIELSLINTTGTNLYGITVRYDCKCLTNGTIQTGGTFPTEESELPGYCFFYSTTGGSSASNWTEVGVAGNAALVNGVPTENALCLPNYTQGTTMSSGPVNISFASPLPNNGVMYLRWADDNNSGDNPDQMLAIDNVSVTTYNPYALQVSISSPAQNAALALGANIVIAASATNSGAAITNIEFYANAADLGGVTNSPYNVTWRPTVAGNYALTAVASDNSGGSVTSAVVNVTVALVPPTVGLRSPNNDDYFLAPAAIGISASASAPGTITNVAFYEGTNLLGNATNAPYAFSWTNVPAGTYTLTAQVADNNGFSAASPLVTVRVIDAPSLVEPVKFRSDLKITFSGYTQGAALTNFPVLLRLSTNISGFSYSQFASPIGADLQFTYGTNLQALPYEIEQWNPAGESIVWVQVPLIKGPSDYIRAYWGNPALTNAAPSNSNGVVWKTSFLQPGFPGTSGAGPLTNTVKLVQLSDTHLGVSNAPDAALNLQMAVPLVNALNPDAVIVSGDVGEDVTQRAQAKTILQALRAPVYYVPGNHDITDDTNSLQSWRDQFGPDYYSFETKNVKVLMLDSELLGNYDNYNAGIVEPLSAGMAAESQKMLNWLSLQGGTTNVLIAVQHIPLFLDNGFPDGNPYWTVNPPYDQSESSLLANLGITHLLAGHWHNGRVFTQNGLTIHVAPSTSWLPFGGQLGFAVHTIAADGNVTTTFVPLNSTPQAASSDFELVWHLNQTDFPFTDSTLQSPGLPGAGTAPASGVAGPGVAFSGATYLSAGTVNLSNSFTVSAWINVATNAINIQTVFASKPGAGTANGFAFNVDDFNTTDGALRFITGNGSSTAAITSAPGTVGFGQWHLVTAAVDTLVNTARIYVDGVEVTQGANSILPDFSRTNTVLLGKAADSSWFFHGAMDEARIQAGAQSSSWIWACWATVAANSGFAAYASVGNPAGPQASITSPGNNASIAPGSDLTIAVSASDLGATITNLEFFANSTDLGSGTIALSSLTWTNIPAGSYALTVVASDDAGLSITSDVVNVTVVYAPPLTVTLTSPADGARFSAPADLALEASVTGGRGAITNVAFYLGSGLLATVTNAPYAFTTANIFGGAYAITAVATDSSGASSTSSAVNITITNSAALTVLQAIKTFFIIPIENHDFTQPNPTASPQQLLGNPACPYFNSLITPGHINAAQVAYATHYYSVALGEHPSEPNYIWTEAGTDFGIHTDNDPSASAQNLFTGVMHLSAQLTAAGVSWRSYQEDVEYSPASTVSASGSGVAVNPYNGSTYYNYLARHNPMVFFTDTQNRNCYPLTNFWRDLANGNTGRYNWITPDLYNEMHNPLPNGFTYHGITYTGDQAAVAAGDNFLSIAIPRIMASQAYKDHGAIILWSDETDSTDDTNTTLSFVVISPLAKGNAYASALPYSHASMLKTMDEVFGLAYQTNLIPAGELNAENNGYNYVDGRSATINNLSDLFLDGPIYQEPRIVGGQMLLGPGGFQLTFSGPAGQTYEVLTSDNLSTARAQWQVVGNGTFGQSDAVFTDSQAKTHPDRFYLISSP